MPGHVLAVKDAPPMHRVLRRLGGPIVLMRSFRIREETCRSGHQDCGDDAISNVASGR